MHVAVSAFLTHVCLSVNLTEQTYPRAPFFFFFFFLSLSTLTQVVFLMADALELSLACSC